MALPATDTFDRSDGPVGANWSGSVGGDLVVASNMCTGVTGGDNNSMYWNADAPNANQYAQCTVEDLGGDHSGAYCGPLVRASATNWIILDAASTVGWLLEHYNSALWTQLGGTYATGAVDEDIAKITVAGTGASTVIKGYVNGTLRLDIDHADDADVDNVPTSGYGGIYDYGVSKGVDDFEVGNLAADIVLTATQVDADIQLSWVA